MKHVSMVLCMLAACGEASSPSDPSRDATSARDIVTRADVEDSALFPDASAPGEPCSFGEQCRTGICADGVCCATECGGCSGCTEMRTGEPDGICRPLVAGTDPLDHCPGSTCDGAGECLERGDVARAIIVSDVGPGVAEQRVEHVAFNGSGGIVVSGMAEGSVTIGDDAFAGDGRFLVSYGEEGETRYVERIEGDGVSAIELAVAGSIEMVLLDVDGYAQWTGASAGNRHDALGASDGVLFALYDESFMLPLASTGVDHMADLGALPRSEGGSLMVVSGTTEGTLSVFGDTVVGTPADPANFLVTLSGLGLPQSVDTFSYASETSAPKVVAPLDGPMRVAVTLHGKKDFGAGPITTRGGDDVVVVVHDGETETSTHIGGTSDERVLDLAVDELGATYVLGTYVDAAGVVCSDETGTDGERFFVARISPSGTHEWSRCFHVATSAAPLMAVDTRGVLLVVTRFGMHTPWYAATSEASATTTTTLVPLTPEGALRGARVMAASGADAGVWVDDIVSHGSGVVTLVGAFEGDLDFGDGVVHHSRGRDGFVLQYSR